MSKFVSKSNKPGMNALNTDFTQPGAGLKQAEVTVQNLRDKWAKLMANRGNKEGGSKQLVDNLARWTETKNAQHFVSQNPEQAALFKKSVETGQIQPGLKPETMMAALDWGIRENDRSQQHKENFLDSAWGKLLGKLVQVGVGFIPGIGVPVATAIGAGIGAAQAAAQTRPSGLDITLGGLGGAAAGYGGAQLHGAIDAAGGVGNYVRNGVDAVRGFVEHPIDSLTGVMSDVGAAPVNNVNQFMPGDVAARAATGAGALAGNALPGTVLDAAGRVVSAAGGAGTVANAAGAAGAAASAMPGGFGSIIDTAIRLGGPIVAGAIGAGAARDAAHDQADAARAAAEASLTASREAIAAQERATARARKDLEPWRLKGQKALDLQGRMLGFDNSITPAEVMKLDPGYQFRLREGLKSIDAASALARGPGLSGATLKELSRYGSDYASNEFGNVFARASNVSGQGLGAATGQANFTQQGAANNANTLIHGADTASDYNVQGANANAAGTIASGNALGGAINNISQQYYLQQLLNGRP